MPDFQNWLIAASQAPPIPARTHSALALFLIVVGILGTLLVCLMLVLARHRLRHHRPEPDAPLPTVDPWHAAAQRIEPMSDDDIRE